MVLLDETVEDRLEPSAAHLPEFQWHDLLQGGFNGRVIDLDLRWFFVINRWVYTNARGRQTDVSRAVKREHEASANHVTELAVLLNPVPLSANLYGQCPPAVIGIVCDELVDEIHILRGGCPASVFDIEFHVLILPYQRVERKS